MWCLRVGDFLSGSEDPAVSGQVSYEWLEHFHHEQRGCNLALHCLCRDFQCQLNPSAVAYDDACGRHNV